MKKNHLQLRARTLIVLFLCLVVGQIAAAQHSVDHYLHDNTSYCDALFSLEKTDNLTGGTVFKTTLFETRQEPCTNGHNTLPAIFFLYLTRAPPSFSNL